MQAVILLLSIHYYQVHAYARAALKFSHLVFVRITELRSTKWSEIDFGAIEWRILCHKIKMDKDHIPFIKASRENSSFDTFRYLITGNLFHLH
jgi:integrase